MPNKHRCSLHVCDTTYVSSVSGLLGRLTQFSEVLFWLPLVSLWAGLAAFPLFILQIYRWPHTDTAGQARKDGENGENGEDGEDGQNTKDGEEKTQKPEDAEDSRQGNYVQTEAKNHYCTYIHVIFVDTEEKLTSIS